ncbi:MAG: glycosyltransferase family 4 protein [Chloroflexota bacterium]
MKIAVIAPSAMPARRANTIQTAKMAQAFAVLGHEVLLIASPSVESPSPHNRGASIEGSLEWSSLAHHYGLRTPFQIAWMRSLPALKRYDFALRAVLRALIWRADLIYTRLPQAAALASLLGIPTIFEIHDLPQGGAAKLLRLFLRGRGALRLVTITQALSADLQRAFPIRAVPAKRSALQPFLLIAPDGVDIDRYTPWLTPQQARQQLQSMGVSLPERFIAGYSGHLYAGRGIELIFDLASRLPDSTFLLVGGEEADLQHWQSILRQQSLSNVILHGFVPNAELPLYQMACDVLLMPYQEQVAASSGGNIAAYLSPMKLFEYLACGRPILASDLPVFHEILNSQTAILLPPDDSQAWLDALLDLEKSPTKRQELSRSARQTAAIYSWEERAGLILTDLH